MNQSFGALINHACAVSKQKRNEHEGRDLKNVLLTNSCHKFIVHFFAQTLSLNQLKWCVYMRVVFMFVSIENNITNGTFYAVSMYGNYAVVPKSHVCFHNTS